MVGSFGVAYSALSARINRVSMTPLRPGEARWPRRWHDLQRRRAHIAYRIGTYTCMPYVYNWSQDVEKCTLDLVLSSYTHTNAVQAIAVASKGCWFFLLHPLPTRWVQ